MIREMTKADFINFWPTFESVIQAQETYAFEPDIDAEKSFSLWCELPIKTFVYEEGNKILGSYYVKANAMGPGAHVSNCGYMISEEARGRGLARKLCEHSQLQALKLGFKSMQFNCVVSTNDIAVKLWQKLGFSIVGTLPRAYNHKKLGYVDCYVMYKQL